MNFMIMASRVAVIAAAFASLSCSSFNFPGGHGGGTSGMDAIYRNNSNYQGTSRARFDNPLFGLAFSLWGVTSKDMNGSGSKVMSLASIFDLGKELDDADSVLIESGQGFLELRFRRGQTLLRVKRYAEIQDYKVLSNGELAFNPHEKCEKNARYATPDGTLCVTKSIWIGNDADGNLYVKTLTAIDGKKQSLPVSVKVTSEGTHARISSMDEANDTAGKLAN